MFLGWGGAERANLRDTGIDINKNLHKKHRKTEEKKGLSWGVTSLKWGGL